MIEIKNRKALYDYIISDTYEAGIVLTGTEIKSIREGKANLKDSYAIIKKGECFILGMHISPYDKGNRFNHDEYRTRKLLLHKNKFQSFRIFIYFPSIKPKKQKKEFISDLLNLLFFQF